MKINQMLRENGLIGNLAELPDNYPWRPRKLFLTKYCVMDLEEWRNIGSIKSIEVEESFWPKSHIIVNGTATMYYDAPAVGYHIPYQTEIKTKIVDHMNHLSWTQKIPLLEVYKHHDDTKQGFMPRTFRFSLAEKIYIKLIKLYRGITKWKRKEGKN